MQPQPPEPKIPDETTTKKQTEVNFRVRQKEQMSWNGSFYGKSWKFERANIVSDPIVGANERAPHDGEFVGTIEVVVLRCYPSVYTNPSFNSAETLVNRGPSSSDSSSDSDGLPNAMDGPGDPKPKPKAMLGPRFRAFGLDGSWDGPVSSTSQNERQKKLQENSWDNWGGLPAATEDPSNKSWGDWNNPSSAKDEQKMGTVEMTGADTGVYHPPSESSSTRAASQAGSGSGSRAGSVFEPKASSVSQKGPQSSKSWGNWNEPSLAKDEPKKGSVEATHSNTGIHNFIGGSPPTNAASKAGPKSGSQGNQLHKAPSASSQQTPRAVELRGGGISTYSAPSRRGSTAGSPVFNVGFYNGVGSGVDTPPSLSMGPPPPRNWQAEERAKRATTKQGHKPTEQPVVDAWGDLPAFDMTNDATAGVGLDPKDKVDSWNAGASDMPGAWGTSNEQKKDDNGWGTTSEKPQEVNDDSWGAPANDTRNDETSNDAGNDSAWHAPNGDARSNGTWPGAGKASDWEEPAGDDAGWTNANEKPSDKGDNWKRANYNNEAKPSDDWNGNDISNAQQDNDWNAGNGAGEDDGNKQNDGWGNNNVEKTKPADDKPIAAKGSKKGSKAGSVGKGSKAGSVGKAESVKSKGKSPGSRKPGGWSPPPKPKKGTLPEAVQPVFTTTQAEPFSVSAVPKAKPYWSTWKNPKANEEIIEKEPTLPAEEPLYAIPEEVAVRNNMSHQVRPGRPSTYTHKVSRPKYMDTHENPYAIFVFQYRDKAIIENMLQTTIAEPEIDEKQRLSSLPKAELIEELLKEKVRSASGSSSSGKAATFRSNPSGIPLEPNANALKAKLSKLEGSKAATPDMVGAWVDSAHGNGNSDGTGPANGKGNWGKKAKTKGQKNKGGDNWAGGGGDNWNWGSDDKKGGDTAGDAWDNNGNEPVEDKKEDEKKDADDNGNWTGFNQDAGASSWKPDEEKDDGNRDTDVNDSGRDSWGDTAGDGGGGGGGGGGW